MPGCCLQEQYMFVYHALLEALAAGDTAIPCSVFMQRYTELKRQNPSTGKSQCHEEFEVFSVTYVIISVFIMLSADSSL